MTPMYDQGPNPTHHLDADVQATLAKLYPTAAARLSTPPRAEPHKPRRLALHAVIARLLDGWQPADVATTTPFWYRYDHTAEGRREVDGTISYPQLDEDMTADEAHIVNTTLMELHGMHAFRARTAQPEPQHPETSLPVDLRIRADAPDHLLTDEMRWRRDHNGGRY